MLHPGCWGGLSGSTHMSPRFPFPLAVRSSWDPLPSTAPSLAQAPVWQAVFLKISTCHVRVLVQPGALTEPALALSQGYSLKVQ